MASTNKTTHYELSQYVGSDKPTYLTDYNNDMSAIDTGIYNAQTKADTAFTNAGSADTKADNAQLTANQALNSAGTANTNIGTMANLNTTDKTSLVNAINEVNNNLNFTSFKQYNAQSADYILYQANMIGMNLNLATTYNGAYAKVYGQIFISSTQSYSSKSKLTLTNTGLNISSEFTVLAGGLFINSSDRSIERADLTFKTNGNIEIETRYNLNTGDYQFIFFPCVIQVKSFGDQPE